MARLRKRKSRRRFALPEVSLTPLIDTALTLLIIFMVTTPMIQNNIKVELPQGQSKEAHNQQDYVVTITKDKQIFFNSFPVREQELAAHVKRALGSNEDAPVFVRADEAVSYGDVVRIVDQLKGVVRHVALSTRSITKA
jgi:biopolymer transport protein ExbD